MHGDPVLASISYQTGSCVFMVFCSLHSFISQPQPQIKPFCGSLNLRLSLEAADSHQYLGPLRTYAQRSWIWEASCTVIQGTTHLQPTRLALSEGRWMPTHSLPAHTNIPGWHHLHTLFSFFLRAFFSPPSGEKSSHSPLPQAPFSSEYSCGCLV